MRMPGTFSCCVPVPATLLPRCFERETCFLPNETCLVLTGSGIGPVGLGTIQLELECCDVMMSRSVSKLLHELLFSLPPLGLLVRVRMGISTHPSCVGADHADGRTPK
jgi:hypothetical protein